MNERLVEEVQNTETATDTPELPEVSTHNPEDVAAAFFKMNQPRLNFLINKLSAKQMRRLIFNVCSYPFVSKEYLPKDDDEKSAAYLVNEMMINKSIMMLSYEMQKAESALQNQVSSDTITEEVKEENNGQI